MEKICKVVMLPTKEWSSIQIKGIKKHQCLYILSNDKIEEGDWFLTDDRMTKTENNYTPKWVLLHCDNINNSWIESNTRPGEGFNPDWSKKIIATNDTSIKKISSFNGTKIYEPFYLIPQTFINFFVNALNKGNKIEEVNVEYDVIDINEPTHNEFIKLNRDNTINIIIKPTKDTWNKEEILALFKKGFSEFEDARNFKNSFDEWAKINL